MKHYQSPVPRLASALAALAMTAVTIGAMVVLPSSLESADATDRSVVASPAPTQARIAPSPQARPEERRHASLAAG